MSSPSAQLETLHEHDEVDECGYLEMKLLKTLDGVFSETGEHKIFRKEYITSLDRSFGTHMSAKISEKYGKIGLEGSRSITVNLKGHAGPSFCAFLAKGITVTLEGIAKDNVGKGLCGGKIVVYPPKTAEYKSEENPIIGNVALYGATSGECWFRGVAGERFAVRNSGANVIVEAVGDHGCEYMTGGRVIVLGTIGRNFAAAMSGGIAYVFSQEDNFSCLINSATVDLDDASTEDLIFVKSKIEEFVKLTGSELAQRILTNWQTEHLKIIKVFPRDFKRVLAEQEEERKKQAELESANLDMSLNSLHKTNYSFNQEVELPRTRALSMDMDMDLDVPDFEDDLQEADHVNQNGVEEDDVEDERREVDEDDQQHEEGDEQDEDVFMSQQRAMDLARGAKERKVTLFTQQNDLVTCQRCCIEGQPIRAQFLVDHCTKVGSVKNKCRRHLDKHHSVNKRTHVLASVDLHRVQ